MESGGVLEIPLCSAYGSSMQARGEIIRRRRQLLGYGLNRFAAKINISPSHLSRVERGIKGAQPEVLQRIAQGLDAAVEDIACETKGNA